MNWGIVGKKIVGMGVPLVGSMLLGGPAGAIAGTGAVNLASTLIASALGVEPEPDKVLEAIQNDPAAIVKIKEIEADQKVELRRLAVESETNRLAAETSQLGAVNATMQAEAKSKWWFSAGWRPLWGYLSAIAFFEAITAIVVLMSVAVYTNNYGVMAVLPQVIGALFTLFGIPAAICGITSWNRGKMQRIQAGEASGPGILGAIASRIGGKYQSKGQ